MFCQDVEDVLREGLLEATFDDPGASLLLKPGESLIQDARRQT
jgi:hypothetical protein